MSYSLVSNEVKITLPQTAACSAENDQDNDLANAVAAMLIVKMVTVRTAPSPSHEKATANSLLSGVCKLRGRGTSNSKLSSV